MRERVVEGIALREWGDASQPGVLLWPGLGSSSAYFSGLVGLLPGRLVAVDPPGWGASRPPEVYSYEGLVALAGRLVRACSCAVILGHSLGADLSAGVAADPPPGLRAAVLVDGGYMDAGTRAAHGVPATAPRAEVVEWVAANAMRFRDWETAFREVAALVGSAVTPAIEAVVRAGCVEVNGEIADAAPPELVADLLLAVAGEDVIARAERLAVPTLLLASGLPAATRPSRQRAWEAFARAAPQAEVHVADDWGHNPLLQDPAASAVLISDWLARVLDETSV